MKTLKQYQTIFKEYNKGNNLSPSQGLKTYIKIGNNTRKYNRKILHEIHEYADSLMAKSIPPREIARLANRRGRLLYRKANNLPIRPAPNLGKSIPPKRKTTRQRIVKQRRKIRQKVYTQKQLDQRLKQERARQKRLANKRIQKINRKHAQRAFVRTRKANTREAKRQSRSRKIRATKRNRVNRRHSRPTQLNQKQRTQRSQDIRFDSRTREPIPKNHREWRADPFRYDWISEQDFPDNTKLSQIVRYVNRLGTVGLKKKTVKEIDNLIKALYGKRYSTMKKQQKIQYLLKLARNHRN